MQKHHSFSYASPAMPLLGGQGAEKVLASPKGSYYAPSQVQAAATSSAAAGNGNSSSATSKASAYEIQSYLLGDSAKPETTTYLRSSPSSDAADTAGRDMLFFFFIVPPFDVNKLTFFS